MRVSFGLGALLFASAGVHHAAAEIPSKIYGVNLGSWLVLEPWMLPAEWTAMGGEICGSCQNCIGSEFAFAQAYPKAVDSSFAKHWSTWFTQDDVNQLKSVGINTVRIPLGYWIVEQLVNRKTEFYPRGGISYLQQGLQMLNDAGIQAILDHHALPGVQTADQSFTGQCTSNVQFYTKYNYHRALVWTAVMTALSHLDPHFASVFAIEAVNEPIMDATQTPGYGGFQKNFVQVVRAVELVLGIPVPGMTLDTKVSTTNFTSALTAVSKSSTIFSSEVKSVLLEAVPILVELGIELSIPAIFNSESASAPLHSVREPLVTNFMDVNWQYNNPPNPANASIGPQGYDNHLYYSPLWFGEWGLPTQFNATDEFLFKWADAQKLAYSQGAGWIFWNFKTEISALAGDLARQWSYLEGVKLGYLTTDPSQVNDPHVCDPYVNAS